jgi:membrane-associated protease RseP (regulator of RpoE activity)
VCKKVGVEPDKKGWGTFDRLELEGGVVIPKAMGRVEDIFQLKGMNALGLAGTELHGVLGYNILARYKMEFDLTRDKLSLTPLKFDPPAPESIGDGKSMPAEIELLANLFKMIEPLLKDKMAQPVVARGFLGLELADGDGTVTVKSVLADGPAAQAGLKAGDRITEIQGKKIKNTEEARKLADAVATGDPVRFTISRGGNPQQITVKTGEGL